MRLAPRRSLLAVSVLLPLLAAGCGDDEDPFDAYCAVVEDQKAGLAQALDDASTGSAGLLPALPAFERLEDAAPDDIADDWSVVVQRLRALAQALEDAGADPATYDAAEPPEGVTEAQQEAIALAAGSLDTEGVALALGNVEQQAKDVCGTSLLR